MANTTLKGSLNIHGTNPQYLVEKVVRARIYDSLYWKESCFALTAETVIDRAMELQYVGGTYGTQKPSPFICLVLKLLQLQPEKEVILEYLAAEEFKYLRALAAMYVRLTFKSAEVFELLEPMLNDYRKLRRRDMSGAYRMSHMDEFIDELLTEERVCETILPRLTRRDVLEESEGLPPRVSKLEDALLYGKSGAEADGGDSGAESDDSMHEELKERKKRAERAKRVREERLAEEDNAADVALGNRAMDDEMEYLSQEESEEEDGQRYVSRSPSASDEGDGRERYISRSPSGSVPDGQDSRSQSPGGSIDGNENGYISRSHSRSPDRS